MFRFDNAPMPGAFPPRFSMYENLTPGRWGFAGRQVLQLHRARRLFLPFRVECTWLEI